MADRIAALATSVPHVPAVLRRYEPITPDQFQVLLDRQAYASKLEHGGWTILDYDRVVFTRAPAGHCLAMSIAPTDPSRYFK